MAVSRGRSRSGDRTGDVENIKRRRAVKGGRPVPPGPVVSIDYDKAQELLSGQHQTDDYYINTARHLFEEDLMRAKERGENSRARKLARVVGQQLEAQLALRASWCPTCLQVLHNCTCVPIDPVRGASVDFIDGLMSRLPHHELRQQRKEVERQERKARKSQLRQGRI